MKLALPPLVPRNRIGLSMRMDDTPGEKRTNESRGPSVEKHNRNEARRNDNGRGNQPAGNSAFAAAFAAAQNKKR